MDCGVLSGAVEEQYGVGALANMARDLVEVELHRLDIGIGQGERCAAAAGPTDGSEQIGVVIKLVGGLARPVPGLADRPLFWPVRASFPKKKPALVLERG
jgi:hypothetical protein